MRSTLNDRSRKEFGVTSTTTSMSGFIPRKSDGSNTFEANPRTFILGWTHPGRSANDPQRGDVELGVSDRYKVYLSTNAGLYRYMDIFDASWKAVFDETFTDWASKRAEGYVPPESLSVEDAMALIDPDVVLWGKVDYVNLSKDVRARLYFHQERDEVHDIINRISLQD